MLAELTVSLTEDDANDLANAEEPDALRERILSRIPESGFLSISTAGDMSLIKRHQQALRQLQEQGGYAPYLTDYLFEAAQVSVPQRLEPVTQWANDKLNPAQKEAVVKILSAPDLCLVQGPPGTGKTMLARRLPGILPPLSPQAELEVLRIRSVAGLPPVGGRPRRPFRAPHHTISAAGLVGGGSIPMPGEITLAHGGVLFLDELAEFSRSALASLRQPCP